MAALRAGYLAVLLSVVGTLGVAFVILAPPTDPGAPTTIAAALDAPQSARLDARRALAVARATSACMARLGFAYDAIPAAAPTIPDGELDPVAWAERWGFGVAPSVGYAGLPTPPDANDRRLARLTDDERARYLDALHGDGSERAGCHGTAAAAVYDLRDRLLMPLQSPMAELAATIEEDPAAAAVVERWAACVTAIGLADPDRATLITRLRTTYSEQVAAAVSDPGWLAVIVRDERRVATAIARCEASYGRDMAAVSAPHEARFVAMYRSLLTRIGARIRAAEAAYPTLDARVPAGRAGPF